MIIYTPSLYRRKYILKKVSHDHPQWKRRMSVVIILCVLAAALIVGTVILLICQPTSLEGIFLFAAAGICFASIPFAIALSQKNKAKYKCGFPYSSYANGTLLLSDDSLEYIFWRVGPQEPAAYSSKHAVYNEEDKFTYSIRKTDAVSISFQNDICTIRGNGKIEIPEWAGEDLIVKRNVSEFSFILAFEQEGANQSIMNWRN